MRAPTSARSWIAVVRAVAGRPGLWATAVGQVFRLSPTGWWRRAPFVPRPDPAYVRFRVATQYGPAEGVGVDRADVDTGDVDRVVAGRAPDPHDVVEYLEWCRCLAGPPIGRPTHR